MAQMDDTPLEDDLEWVNKQNHLLII
jgi:hypothetical protein